MRRGIAPTLNGEINMNAIVKAVLFCAAAGASVPATAAYNFTITNTQPIGFASNSTAFIFTLTEQAIAATTYNIFLRYYDYSCVNNPFCQPNVEVKYTRNAGPVANTATFHVSGATGRLYPRDIAVVFETTSDAPVTISNLTTRFATLVPEPTTWALMLAGFAMTGYALRRRRAEIAFA
jgi:hypothetical protein